MTKSNPRQRTERKSIRKRRNEKYNFIHFDDSEVSFSSKEETRSRVPSKHQYLRLKKKSFVQTYSSKIAKGQVVPESIKDECSEDNVIPQDIQSKVRKPSESFSNDCNTSSSMLSYQIQPDWSDFEDMDHIKFVSEYDVNLSNILQLLGEHQNTYDMDTFEDLSLPFDYNDSNLSNWVVELSGIRYGQAVISIHSVETQIKNNYKSLFKMDHNLALWVDILTETNNLLVHCHSNKCLLQDILMKDHSFSLQETSFKWGTLTSKCSSIKSCLEIIKDSETTKSNFQMAIEIMYDQCQSLLEHGVLYPNPLVIRIVDGIKKISTALSDQYKRIENSLCELFEDYESSSVFLLDQLDREINRMENISCVNGNTRVHLESISKVLAVFLGREKNWKPFHEPVQQSCHVVKENINSYIGVMKQKSDVYHLSVKVPFRFILVILMSLMCLFGNLEFENNNSLYNYFNETFAPLSPNLIPFVQLNNGSC